MTNQHPTLPVQYAFSLRDFNTFAIECIAQAYVKITSEKILHALISDTALNKLNKLVLGGGSNILLTKDFAGLVLHMCNQGIDIVREDANATYVRVAAGENWHDFVQWTLERGMGGLENLSLIPGSVGAAPIQNIGAYGVEVEQRIHCVRAFDFETAQTITLSHADCTFAYRESVFKHRLRNRVAILDVTFALPKVWQAHVQYADVAQELAARGIAAPNAMEISAAVIAIRKRKLPDPSLIGNAGSFFKNPVVNQDRRDALLVQFPQLVSYAQADGTFKLAAGWLIDHCGWKGKMVGEAGVYEKQALVLVNRGNATGQDIVNLANAIVRNVEARFGVILEPEPIFI